MAIKTNVPWAQASHNFWVGCTKVDEGCRYCYMFRELEQHQYFSPDKVIPTKLDNWKNLWKWKEPMIVFIESWGDFFHKDADEWRGNAWQVMAKAWWHFYVIPTKRPERIEGHLPWKEEDLAWNNVIFEVSTAQQSSFNKYWPILAAAPVAWRGLSMEPLIEPIDIRKAMGDGLNWVQVGGESGALHLIRPMEWDWARLILRDAHSMDAAFFMKQKGGAPTNKKDQMVDFPPDLQVREYPFFIRRWLKDAKKRLAQPEQIGMF